MGTNPHPCPPPKGFKRANDIANVVACVRPTNIPPEAASSLSKDRKIKEGLKYERKGHIHLERLYPNRYIPGPWFRWTNTAGKSHYCQPDGLIIDPSRATITICEYKLKHISKAWWQLRHLYKPVVRAAFGNNWRYRIVEIVKWFDPHTAFPESITFAQKLRAIDEDKFYVHVWNGR